MNDVTQPQVDEVEVETVEPSEEKTGLGAVTSKTSLWAFFGFLCIVAIVAPAGWVIYTHQNQSGFVPAVTVPKPSQEQTQTATPDQTQTPEEINAMGEDLENWEYATSGRNVFKNLLPKKITYTTTNTSTGVTEEDIVLKSIGKDSHGDPVAVFTVNGKQYEAGVGDQIGSTGWYVKTIGTASVTLSETSGSTSKELEDAGK